MTSPADRIQTSSPAEQLAALLVRVRAVLRALEAASVTDDQRPNVDATVARLTNSVIRPLEVALRNLSPSQISDDRQPDIDAEGTDALGDETLWQIAQDATRLRVKPGMPTEVVEATAALQELACRFARSEDVAERVAALREMQAALLPSILSQ